MHSIAIILQSNDTVAPENNLLYLLFIQITLPRYHSSVVDRISKDNQRGTNHQLGFKCTEIYYP